MWQQIRNNPRAAVLAIIAHVVFVAVLLVSFTFSDDEDVGSKGPKLEAIQAEAIDEKQIQAELNRRRDAEKHQQQKIKDQARKKKEAQLREKKRQADKKKKWAAEKKRKQEKKKQLAAEKKRKLAEKKKKQKQAKEKKRKAELKKKQLAEEQKRKEIERKRIEEEQRKHEQQMAQQDAEMQQRLAADRQRRAAAQQAANKREVSRFLGLIKNAVTRHWTLPSNEVSGLSCEVKVKIIPNGEVIDVQIIKSSGNLVFDHSVEKAVYRAAPLPVPSIESGLFDKFREVNFVFNPGDL